MEQMWQVCELEESGNIRLTHFERFSVTQVPEGWIVLLQDGTWLCFWPSVDPESKIRSLHRPEFGEKCKYYKCRILLDGAKFSSYEEAEEAVQIAQNVSSIMDSSVSMGIQEIENACDGTMDFDVAEYANGDENNDDTIERDNSGFDISEDDTEEKNEIAKPDSFGFDVSDTDDENGQIVGHDSFEFNKAILKGYRYYLKKAMTFEVENLGNLPIDANDTILSDIDYNAKFKLNDANFSTSTAVDDMDFQQTIKKSVLSEIMMKIAAIELKVSLFVESIQKELNDLKEALMEKVTKVVQEKEVVSSNSGFWKLNRKEQMRFFSAEKSNVHREKTGGVPLSSQSTPAFVEDVHFENDLNETKSACVSEHASDTLNDQNPKILNIISPGNDACDESNVQRKDVDLVPLNSHELTENALNNTFVLKSSNAHVSAGLQDEVSRILNIEILPVLVDSKVSVDVEAQHEAQDEANLMEVEPQDNPYELRFPCNEVDDHKRNEDLLEEEVFDSALINLLALLRYEDEATYMERSVGKVFTDKFFLNSVSWKNQPKRINMKDSKLLCCWKKSKKRAQIKAQKKRLTKAKVLSKKK